MTRRVTMARKEQRGDGQLYKYGKASRTHKVHARQCAGGLEEGASALGGRDGRGRYNGQRSVVGGRRQVPLEPRRGTSDSPDAEQLRYASSWVKLLSLLISSNSRHCEPHFHRLDDDQDLLLSRSYIRHHHWSRSKLLQRPPRIRACVNRKTTIRETQNQYKTSRSTQGARTVMRLERLWSELLQAHAYLYAVLGAHYDHFVLHAQFHEKLVHVAMKIPTT